MLGFGLLALLTLAVSVLSHFAQSSANARFAEYVDEAAARNTLVLRLQTAVDRRAISVRDMVIAADNAAVREEVANAAQAHQEVRQRLQRLTEMVAAAASADATERRLVDEINRIEAAYTPVALAILDLGRSGRREDAVRMIEEECEPLLNQLVSTTDAYADYTEGLSAQLLAAARAEYANKRSLLAAISLVALVAAGVSGWLITRSLTRALGAEPADLAQVAARVAEGDLSPVRAAAAAPPRRRAA